MRKLSSVLTENPLAEEKDSLPKKLVTSVKRFRLPRWFHRPKLPESKPVIRTSSDLLQSPEVQEQLEACRRLYVSHARYYK